VEHKVSLARVQVRANVFSVVISSPALASFVIRSRTPDVGSS